MTHSAKQQPQAASRAGTTAHTHNGVTFGQKAQSAQKAATPKRRILPRREAVQAAMMRTG